MTDEQFDAISRKLDLLVGLTALSYVADKKQPEQIMMLKAAGFEPKKTAEILGTTSNTVSVTLSKILKKKRRKTKDR